VPIAGLIVVTLLIPTFLQDPYLLHLAVLVLMWAVAATGWNIIGGYGGQFSFGHAAFFGTGAYACALLMTKAAAPAWLALLVGTALAVVLAIPAGLVFFRLRGPYFALSMLAFAEVVRLAAQNWTALTNGPAGVLLTVPYADKAAAYYVIAALAIVSVLVTWWIASTKLGYCLLAIREDQDVAMMLGVEIDRYKMYALLLSALFTGSAGAFYATYMGYIEPNVVYSVVDVTLPMLLMAIVGGYGTVIGPLVGAVLLTLSREVFITYLGNSNVLIYGVLIVLVTLFMQDGVIGASRGLARRRRAGSMRALRPADA
jgi:branched-chain amino acid transport system permease protein